MMPDRGKCSPPGDLTHLSWSGAGAGKGGGWFSLVYPLTLFGESRARGAKKGPVEVFLCSDAMSNRGPVERRRRRWRCSPAPTPGQIAGPSSGEAAGGGYAPCRAEKAPVEVCSHARSPPCLIHSYARTKLYFHRRRRRIQELWKVDPMETRCAICHGDMGRGHATFTAECSHSFHLHCVHHQSACPLCFTPWRDVPGVAPARELVFRDDEPLEPQPAAAAATETTTASGGVMSIKTHCEYAAIAKDASRDGFAVLVHAKAPALAPAAAKAARAPLDLVMVLDVSGSMVGHKIALLKQAMGFVVDKLGPHDRLSLVSFSGTARRLTRLTRMSGAGKASTERTVESLVAGGGTNIKEGLREAAKVIDGRRYRNAVTGVILLSDGQDNHTLSYIYNCDVATDYSVLVPPSLIRTGDGSSPPIHTFGFGTDHDSAAMHTIAEATGGTFSFIENEAVIQDSFAQCIGGLLSVAAQEARVAVKCLCPGVRVRSIKSGRYKSRVDADGRTATVDVGELYADEERRFLLFVDVPTAGATDDVTSLMKVSCTYRDVATGQSVDVAGEDVVVRRPVEAPEVGPAVEVERERLRMQAAEDIAAARAAAERGEHAEASEMLSRRRMALRQSPLGASGDAECAELAAELGELSERVGDRRRYDLSGRASLLCGMSAHSQQRTSTVKVGRARYATPAMRKMVDLSVKTRQQQAQAQPSPSRTTKPPPPPPPSTTPPSLAKNLVRRYHRFLRLK